MSVFPVAPTAAPVSGRILAKAVGPMFLVRWVSILTALVCVFFPFLVNSLVSSQAILVVVLGVLAVAETFARRENFTQLLLVSVGVIVVLAVVLALTSWLSGIHGTAFVSKMQQYTALLPLGLLAGWSLARSPFFVNYLKAFIYFALISASIGLVEFASQSTLFGRTALLSSAGGKAIAAADHPLVLGILLAVAIALLRPSGFRRPRLAGLFLFAGVLATQTTGPVVIGSLLLLHLFFPKIEALLRRNLWLFPVSVAIIAGAVTYLALFVWRPEIVADNLEDYSFQYRFAMYAMLPILLTYVPLGYGFAGVPEGFWFIPSALRGQRDLSLTVDSEVVFLATELGYFGLVVYAIAIVVSLLALRRSYSAGLFALALTAAGFFIALHAWGSLASVWIVALAVAGFSVSRKSSPVALGRDMRGDATTTEAPVAPVKLGTRK